MRNTNTIFIGAVAAVLLIGAAAIFMCTTTDSNNDNTAMTTDVNAYYFVIEEKADAIRTVDALSEAEIALLIENLRSAEELAQAADEALAQMVVAFIPAKHFCHAMINGELMDISYEGAGYVVIGNTIYRAIDCKENALFKDNFYCGKGVYMVADGPAVKNAIKGEKNADAIYSSLKDEKAVMGTQFEGFAKEFTADKPLNCITLQVHQLPIIAYYVGECPCQFEHNTVILGAEA